MENEPNNGANGAEPSLRVAIVGGGVAGLTAAYDLTRPQPHPGGSRQPLAVTVYEGNSYWGGLAAGFRGRPEWEWPLEHFYHHLFTNDDAIMEFTRELGLGHLLEIHSPLTAVYVRGKLYALDSPLRVLQFPHLSFFNRLRMGLVLAYLRYHPRPPWQQFDKIIADRWLEKWMGGQAYDVIWKPMIEGKFGAHYQDVNLAWFWARVYKRTQRLGYYRGGFQAFVDGLSACVRSQGAEMHLNARIESIRPTERGIRVQVMGEPPRDFDAVLSTTSPGLMQRLAPDMPESYLGRLRNLQSMGAVVLTVALDRQLMPEVYWANIPKREGLPFLGLVEHTNMVDPAHYGGDHLLYIGDYLDLGHRYFDMSAEELLAEFQPHLVKFNPDFRPEWVKGVWVHKAPYAQPVPPVGYLEMIPDVRTPVPGLYFASMSQVYPWDRGTNFAVEMGRKVATLVREDIRKGQIQPARTVEPSDEPSGELVEKR